MSYLPSGVQPPSDRACPSFRGGAPRSQLMRTSPRLRVRPMRTSPLMAPPALRAWLRAPEVHLCFLHLFCGLSMTSSNPPLSPERPAWRGRCCMLLDGVVHARLVPDVTLFFLWRSRRSSRPSLFSRAVVAAGAQEKSAALPSARPVGSGVVASSRAGVVCGGHAQRLDQADGARQDGDAARLSALSPLAPSRCRWRLVPRSWLGGPGGRGRWP